MGVSVRQKIKGKGQPWWVFITHNGKRRSRKIGTKATAKRIAAEIQEKLTKKAGLRDIKLHGLRHAYVSILLSEGVSLFYVSKQLGHSGINITSDIYGHFIPSEGNREVDLLDAPAPTSTLSAPKALFSQKEKPRLVDIAVNSSLMVPKARLELAQIYIH